MPFWKRYTIKCLVLGILGKLKKKKKKKNFKLKIIIFSTVIIIFRINKMADRRKIEAFPEEFLSCIQRLIQSVEVMYLPSWNMSMKMCCIWKRLSYTYLKKKHLFFFFYTTLNNRAFVGEQPKLRNVTNKMDGLASLEIIKYSFEFVFFFSTKQKARKQRLITALTQSTGIFPKQKKNPQKNEKTFQQFIVGQ